MKIIKSLSAPGAAAKPIFHLMKFTTSLITSFAGHKIEINFYNFETTFTKNCWNFLFLKLLKTVQGSLGVPGVEAGYHWYKRIRQVRKVWHLKKISQSHKNFLNLISFCSVSSVLLSTRINVSRARNSVCLFLSNIEKKERKETGTCFQVSQTIGMLQAPDRTYKYL